MYYQNAHAKYSVNGVFTKLVSLSCGLLQGDPSSTLLYIIVIQPFLNYIANEDIGIELKTTVFGSIKLSHVAFADDVWVFIKDSKAFETFETISRWFARVSNSKFNIHKTRYHILEDDTNIWARSALSSAYQNLPDEFIMLGIPLRVDGDLPEKTLQIALAKLSNSKHWAGFNEMSYIGRVNVVNSLLSSKLWYCLQIGPIAPWILTGMQRFMTNYIFHSKRGFVAFPLVCLPKHLGGLNLLDPEAMTTAMQGKWLSTVFTEVSVAGSLFKKVYAEAMLVCQNKPPIFCIIHPPLGVKKETHVLSPFFRRVVRTLKALDASLVLDFSMYTTDQVLSLPWKHNRLYRNHLHMAVRGLGNAEASCLGINWNSELAGVYVGRTFRDVLFWDLESEVMVIPSLETVDFVLQSQRYEKIRENRGQYAELRKAWRLIARHMPTHVKERIPPEMASLILTRERPQCCNTIRRTRGTIHISFHNYQGFDLERMIPWHDMMLAGKPINEYKVKEARLYVQLRKQPTNYVHIPNHKMAFPDKELERQAWRIRWKDLHSQKHTPEHVSINWIFLHNRVQLARDYQVKDALWDDFVMSFKDTINTDSDFPNEDDSECDPDELYENDTDEEDEDYDPHSVVQREDLPRESYEVLDCPQCGLERDSLRHSYVRCQGAQTFWKTCLTILRKALGSPTVHNTRLLGAINDVRKVTLRDAVFVFPVLRAATANSDALKRISLWHSCCIVTIHRIRADAMRLAMRQRGCPLYDLTTPASLGQCEKEYKLSLMDIFREKYRLDETDGTSKRVHAFKQSYVKGSELAGLGVGMGITL